MNNSLLIKIKIRISFTILIFQATMHNPFFSEVRKQDVYLQNEQPKTGNTNWRHGSAQI